MSFDNAHKTSWLKRRRTRPFPYFLLVILAGLISFLYPYYLWEKQPWHDISLFIMDKTVPNSGYRKHRGLIWVLNHYKYRQKGTTEPFDEQKDYVGFIPLPNHQWDVRQLVDRPEGYDLMYIADTYGVYAADFYLRDWRPTQSRKIYGGLESDEIDIIEKSLKRGATLVAEFNTFGESTAGSPRKRMNNILGVKSTGWVGRFFIDLGDKTEIPDWAYELYRRQYHREWDFTGAGYLLVHRNGHIVILVDEVDVGPGGLAITLTKGMSEHYGIENNVQHTNWFDVVTAAQDTTLVAQFKWDLTPSGMAFFEHEKIPTVFPAIIRRRTPTYLSYYFAGDMIDLDQVPFWYKLYKIPTYFKKLPMDTKSNPKALYWKVFVPLVHTILTEVKPISQGGELRGNASLDGRR